MKDEMKIDESKYIIKLVIKDKLKSEFEKYLKDSADYYDPREPLTKRKLLQMWLDCGEPREKRISDLEKENAELRKVAEFQQSSNMDTHLENKKLKEGLAVGSMWNKHLNSQNKALEEDRDKYRNMVFEQREHLTKAKEIIKKFSEFVNNKVEYDPEHPQEHTDLWNELCEQAEQFLNGEVSE